MRETAREHKEEAPKRLNFAVIICSTSRYRDLEARKQVLDESGDLIVETLQNNGHAVFWRELIPDDGRLIESTVKKALQSPKIDAIIISGGTGISPSDVTVETIEPLLDKRLPGFGELFRSLSYDEIGSTAIMSRATAGVSLGKAIFCLPGSPQAVKLCLERLILPEAGHIILHAHGM
jgi:molybdenum cofactor biosynthesis protein B